MIRRFLQRDVGMYKGFLVILVWIVAQVFLCFGGCAVLPKIPVQAQGIGLAVQHASERTRGDTSNDASVFWALVVNNALVALGLPVIAGLFWYKRKQVNHGKV